jgi:type IV pilus assembly protein PilE
VCIPILPPRQRTVLHAGFTLTELMIVVALISILTLVAYPHYFNSSLETNRKAAQSEMQILALALQRDFTLTDVYTDLIKSGETTIPHEVASHYKLSITIQENGGQYAITAQPIRTQIKDPCGTLRLTNHGTRDADRASCWN